MVDVPALAMAFSFRLQASKYLEERIKIVPDEDFQSFISLEFMAYPIFSTMILVTVVLPINADGPQQA